MLHHISLEVDPAVVADEARFWVAAGFVQVPAPEALGSRYTWFERNGTQIHLIAVDEPVVPAEGHAAIVAADFETALARLREAGFEVREGRELWGAARAKAVTPTGHAVELMASPPLASSG